MTSPLDRLPPYGATGVGSLPMTDPADAVDHVVGLYDLPFCPQLPRLDGDMIAEWLGGEAGRCAWSAERDRVRPHAWPALLRALGASPPAHRVVKLQVTGPVTLCWALGEGDPNTGFAREVAVWLAANARDQVAVLAEHGLDAVVVVDEPALALATTGPTTRTVWEPLRGVAPAWGLHLCCAPRWPLLEAARPDLLSIDVAGHPLTRHGAAACARLIEAGTRIAWGIVPTSGTGGSPAALARLAQVRALVGAAGVDPETLAMRSLLSASCGTGANTVSEELAVASALVRTARTVAAPLQPLQ